MDSAYRHERWRWDPGKHLRPIATTIMVTELSADALAEHEELVRRGAHVVPFGFGRVLAKPHTPADPLLWEGDDG